MSEFRSQNINLLPTAIVAKLRAPLVIRSLAQALEELVANSVDARATCVEVEVELTSLSLSVVDNGYGIAPASFKSVAKRHCTSKLRDQKQFDSGIASLGFKGEALASIAEVSVLQLTSKATGSFETHMKLLKGGKVVRQGLATAQRQKTGTIVCLRDFLFNQPVRRRHFVHSGMQKELEACREALLRLALAHSAVTFVLTTKSPRKQLLYLTKDRAVTDVLPLVFGDLLHSLEEVTHSATSLSVQGYITVPPASLGHKHKQYLYVNNRYVRPGRVGKTINDLFRSVVQRLKQPDDQQQKASQHYPAFALQIACATSLYDITSDPDKAHLEFTDWPAVLSAVQAAILDAWHAVVGDRLLTELVHSQALSVKSCPQTHHTATDAGLALLPVSSNHQSQERSSAWAVSRQDSPAGKHKHQHASAQYFVSQEDKGLTSLFRDTTAFHHSVKSTELPSAHPSAGSQAAPRGLLARLQSSVKLRLAGTGSDVPASAEQNYDTEQLPAPTGISNAYPAQAPWNSGLSQLAPSSPSYNDQLPLAGSNPGAHVSTAVPSGIAEDLCLGRAGQSSLYDTPDTTERPNRHRQKRRASSAPPHYKSHQRSAHTNPLHSLHTDRPGALAAAPTYSGNRHNVADPSALSAGSDPAQAPHAWLQDVQARHRHTISGVCSRLRQKASIGPASTLLPDTFRQKRQGNASQAAQQPTRTSDCGSNTGSFTPSCTPSCAQTSAASALLQPSAYCLPDPLLDSKDMLPPARKRVRFDLAAGKDGAHLAGGQSTTTTPTGKAKGVSAAQPTPPMGAAPLQQQSSVTAVSSQPAFAPPCTEQQQAESLSPSDAHLQQQSSSAMPSVNQLLQSWSNPCMRPSSARTVVDLPSLCAGAVHTVVPTSIIRSDFQQGIALRQMENKFIALVCNGVLSVVDQHAADERVRLEKLRTAVLSTQDYVSSVAVVPPVRMTMTSGEVQLLEMHKGKLEAWGWRWRLAGHDSILVVLTHFGCILNAAMNDLDLQVYLHQLAETNGSSSLPPAVTRILNAKACRSAIMFGDPLLPTECAQLIASLKMTQLCFSCAHGRPTMAPLVNLQALRNHISMHNSASLEAKPSLNDTAPLKQRLCNLLKHS